MKHALSASTQDENEWSPSRSGRYTPGERVPLPRYALNRRLGGPQTWPGHSGVDEP
jgi:hypothetical protein